VAKTVTIEIPDWAEERHIFVFGGFELMAWKPSGKDELWVKLTRCAMCGWCCENLRPDCKDLEQIGKSKVCKRGADRPFICSYSDPKQNNAPGCEACNITYKVEKL